MLGGEHPLALELRPMRVLIVEDDPELAGLLRDGLRVQHIDLSVAATFAEGRDQAALATYDVIILDVRLPGGSGFELCAELRRRGVTAPVLMLTALDAVDDRVRGLEVGADDYLTKPFAFRELLARLKALARRRPALAPAVYRVADLEVDLAARRVHRGSRPLSLTAKEFALLELFISRPGQVPDDHRPRVGRQSRPFHQRPRRARAAPAPQDRRRVRAQADHHAAGRGVSVRTMRPR
jgi:DNA-binding response OmpR family regulator